jgi:hypothetical protein
LTGEATKSMQRTVVKLSTKINKQIIAVLLASAQGQKCSKECKCKIDPTGICKLCLKLNSQYKIKEIKIEFD